jgi:hypothetical protein
VGNWKRYNPPGQMNNIEIIIGLLLLFMAVPDVCPRLSRHMSELPRALKPLEGVSSNPRSPC